MLIRQKLKREEEFGPKGDKTVDFNPYPTVERKRQENAKVVKKHAKYHGDQQTKTHRLDREYENAPGVSPVRARHEIDLFGFKCGVGKTNPILVENVNKIPEPPDYVDPEMLRKMGYAKSPLKNNQTMNISQISGNASPLGETIQKPLKFRPSTAAGTNSKSPSRMKFGKPSGLKNYKSPASASATHQSSFQRKSNKDKLVVTNKQSRRMVNGQDYTRNGIGNFGQHSTEKPVWQNRRDTSLRKKYHNQDLDELSSP